MTRVKPKPKFDENNPEAQQQRRPSPRVPKNLPEIFDLRIFNAEIQAICDKYGVILIAEPVFIPTSHGSFEVGARLAVNQIPKSGE